DPALAADFQATYQPVAAEFVNLIMNWTVTSAPARATLDDLLSRYPERIPLRELVGTVYNLLLQFGIPPGGPVSSLMWFREGQDWREWYRCYDWSVSPTREQIGLTNAARSFLAALEEALKAELMYAIFPHRQRTLEGLAQGTVTYQPSGNPTQPVTEATLAI